MIKRISFASHKVDFKPGPGKVAVWIDSDDYNKYFVPPNQKINLKSSTNSVTVKAQQFAQMLSDAFNKK